jgi:hypothetical protein
MPVNVHNVEVRFKADKARRDAAKFDDSMDRLDKRAGGLGNTMKKMGALIGAVGFGIAARDMSQTIIATERMEASLETMTGSMENANLAFAALSEFATTTPFTVDQSVQAFIKMKSLGLEPTEAALTSFGNTASAMGKEMNDMIEAVADAATGEFERLKEFGIKAASQGDEVAFTFNKVTTTVGKNAEEITAYLESIGNTKFAGAMEKQMERLPGKLSNLRDGIQKMWRAMGDQGVTAAFGRVIDVFSAGIEHITKLITTGFAKERISLLMAGWVTTFDTAFKVISESWRNRSQEMDETTEATLTNQLTAWEGISGAISAIPVTFTKGWQIIVVAGAAALGQLGQLFQVFVKTVGIGMLQFGRGFEVLWEQTKLGVIGLVNWMVEEFSNAWKVIGANLPNVGKFAPLREMFFVAAEGVDKFKMSDEALRESMAVSAGEHADRVDVVVEEIAGHLALSKAIDKAALETVNALGEEDRANKELIKTRLIQARALLEAVAAGKSWQEILDELAKGEEELADATGLTTSEIEKQQKAYATLAQKLQPYMDKLNGISVLERNHTNNMMMVEEAIRMNIVAAEDYDAVLALLDEGLDDTADAHDNLRKTVEDGLERMGQAAADMWGDFVKNGTASMDGITAAFESMLAELAHAASTRPIMLQLQNAADGEEIDFKELGKGILSGAAIYAGAELGGGGKGAAMGASLGTLASGLPGGSIWGPMVGGIIGGMFDRDPRISVSGGQIYGSNGGTTQDTAFGNFITSNGAGGVDEFAGTARRGVAAFDKGIASFLTDEQIQEVTDRLETWSLTLRDGEVTMENILESRFEAILSTFDAEVIEFVSHAGSLEDQVKALGLAMQATAMIADNPDLFGQKGLAEFLSLTEAAKENGEELNETMNRLVAAMIGAQIATEILVDYSTNDLVTAYTESVRLANMTVKEQMLEAGQSVRDIMATYDDTATTVGNLANAVRARYALELQLLAELDTVAMAVTGRFKSLTDTIDDFINPKSIDDHTASLDDLFLQLSEAVDPTEVDRITAEIARVASLAWNALPDDMKEAMGQQFIDVLAEADRLAQERLALIRDQVVAESAILREQIDILMEGISDPMTLVANDLGHAAALLIDAGNAWTTPPVGDGTGGGGGGGGYYDPHNPPNGLDPNGVITTAANTLQSEGTAYRAANATQTAALATAIASIPGRIVVQVVQAPRSEFT